MLKPTQSLAAAAGVLVLGAGLCFLVNGKSHPKPKPGKATLAAADTFGSQPEKAAKDLRDFVAEHKKDKDENVQDKVGSARIRLAYLSAEKKDFGKARETFLAAKQEYKGTNAMGPEFGSIPDQAAYQAAVCLVAENKKDEAEKEFVAFLKDRPLSPLVHAVHNRLNRLNGGESKPEWDQLEQDAVTKQEKNIRFETSVCGPKTIEYLLPKLSKPAMDYKALAKLCGTTDKGTTIENMEKGLKTLGFQTYAYRLNRKDVSKATLPAIVLANDHYVALLKVTDTKITTYDTRFKALQTFPLPKADDPDFCLNVILFSQPNLKVNN